MSLYFRYAANHGGRNNTGRITVRHRGATNVRRFFNFFPNSASFGAGLLARKYRLFELARFNSSRLGVCLKIRNSSYTFTTLPNRIATEPHYFRLGAYASGLTLAKLYTIPSGAYISHVPLSLGGFPKLGRALGSTIQLLKRRGSFVTLKLPSGELRRVSAKYVGFASSLPAKVFYKKTFTRAGQLRRLGVRPSVRGCAMNPVDHPHGGRTGESRPSVSPWGILTKGHKTRTKAVSKRLILLSVQQLKNKNKLLKFFILV